MRAVVTGQIGMDKKPYLNDIVTRGGQRGQRIEVFHLGDMMYSEGPDVRPGRILDLPLSRLNSLRRAAFKDIIAESSPPDEHPNILVNTHATFRWRHGLFPAFDLDQMHKRSIPTCSSASSTTSKWCTIACTKSTTSMPHSRTAWSGAKRKSWPPKCIAQALGLHKRVLYRLSRGRHDRHHRAPCTNCD